MRKHITLIAVFGGALAASNSFGQTGPNSTYYLGGGAILWAIHGLGDTMVNSVSSDEYNIAVDGDIRTTAERSSFPGTQYDLSMNPTGTTYGGTWAGLFDGTTDGVKNYTVDYDTDSVLVFDRDWQNGQTLFSLDSSAHQFLGITYDGQGGLYVSDWAGTMVHHYTMNGVETGSFDVGYDSITCLAMDYTTGTLWMGSQNHKGTFDEYMTDGTHLQTVTYGGINPPNTLGGEFDLAAAVPEPASFAVLGLGLGAFALLRRKRAK
ncbi:MAG: PEP-CTERM sorting domain-containing protein [Armatimonadetes bacterium]|nr:PEP-CTERM sorting domain-containing protein [Armatimonadota bacterium]